MSRLLARDMLLHGSNVNIMAGFAALLLFASEAPAVIALCVYFAPVPYNVFLLSALWRTAELSSRQVATTVRVVGVIWLLVMFVI